MNNKLDFTKGKRGAVIAASGKTRITIYLDDDLVEAFRATAERDGTGYQTLINQALRDSVKRRTDEPPLTVEILRAVLREELHAA
jgi:uncharacterized protein (DUF4415 family)